MNYLSHRIITMLFLLSLFTGGFTQPKSFSSEKDSIRTLSPAIKVTTTRLEVEPEKLPQKIEVIDKLDLEMTVAEDITDVLKKNSSVDIIQYPGVLAGVGIRGFRPSSGSGINQRTITLFDGRPSGATNFASLQPYGVERIEVVKGPVSALYGPQAMGGVVNIIPLRSDGKVKTKVKAGIGSFETLEGVIHSGGALFDFLNYDLSAAIYNQGKDYRIGSEYSLSKISENRFPNASEIIYSDGSSEKVKDLGDGLIRHYTKYDKKDFSLRLGSNLFDDRIKIDVRGEMYAADGVETPGDIAYGDNDAGIKNISRNDEQIKIKGDLEYNKFSLIQYWTEEFSDRFADFQTGDTMYKNYSGGTEWIGLQAKDDIYLIKDNQHIIKPILTFGIDYNKVQEWSRKWQKDGKEIAPYSPGAEQNDFGVYTQFFGDIMNGLATATFGLRYDNITVEIPESFFFPNNKKRKESFNVVSPSYGLTISPLKGISSKYKITVYHNLGKGFIPQSSGNIAGYNVGKPDITGKVQILRGNPNLKPEENITVDGGIRTVFKDLDITAGVGLYHTVVENFVEYSYDSVPEDMTEFYNNKLYPVATIKTYKNNNDKTKIDGFEWELDWNILHLFKRPEKLILSSGGHTILKSETVSEGIKEEVNNIRDPNFNIGLTYDDQKLLCMQLKTRFSGKQRDTDWASKAYPYPDVIYPAFLITDLSIRVKINENNTVGAQISNVTDENYYEKRGYNLPGRKFGISYELSF